jgi:formamidopyrimidine-DNA glycosylase
MLVLEEIEMLELPEALVMARQLSETLQGKQIAAVIAVQTPHKLTWYKGDPQKYPEMLAGKRMGPAAGRGALVVVQAEKATLVFGDGVNLRYHAKGSARPEKHQLLIEFTDSSALSAVVQMYGGIVCFDDGIYDNPYYRAALEKPAVLTPAFSREYFDSLLGVPEVAKLSLKAFLATEQKIPGVGNGVLQDILWAARLHPRKKVSTLSKKEQDQLFDATKTRLADMAAGGGRDTEKDLFGKSGGYICQLSKNTVGKPCPVCRTLIKKEAYLGGSVYYCEGCQKG